MWVSAEISAQAAQASSGVPNAAACNVSVPEATTRHKREPPGWDHRGRFVDQRPDRGYATGADHVSAGDQGADPVREIDQLGTRHAGKEVLVPPGEPDHLMGEDRTDDDGDVGLGNMAIDAHLTFVSVINPPVSSPSRSAPMIPNEVKVSGRHDSWLRIVQPG